MLNPQVLIAPAASEFRRVVNVDPADKAPGGKSFLERIWWMDCLEDFSDILPCVLLQYLCSARLRRASAFRGRRLSSSTRTYVHLEIFGEAECFDKVRIRPSWAARALTPGD